MNGTSSTEIGSSLVFDIYPATLDGFVDVTSWSNGQLSFPDADGDGLLPLGAGGTDPDNTTWDVDGDNLSDQYELDMRALTVEEGGEELDPMLKDTDGDGILDNEELRLGTNPANADSDGDGLPDIVEAARADEDRTALSGGWLFAYNVNAFTRVWSDPNTADYDGDGMTDPFELTQDTCPSCTPWADPDTPQLFSPYVYNENPVPIFLRDNTSDGFVSPSTSFVYSTTTENNLSSGILLAGDVSLALPDIFSGNPLTAEVALTSGYSETLASTITPQASSSATGILTSTMDLAAYEDVVWSWDPADENIMTPVGGDIQQLDAAASPGFSDLFVFTALEIDGSGEQHITAYAAGNDGNPSASAILYRLPQSLGTYGAPEIACNDAGNCLIVWEAVDGSGTGQILGTILNQSIGDHSGALLFRFASSTTLSSPVVASNGDDFMIGWTEDTGSEASTSVMRVYPDGSSSTPLQVWKIGNHGSNPLGIVWTGSTYLAVWINAYNGAMYRAEIDTSLDVGPVTTVPGEAEIFANVNGVVGPLSLTYDPLSDQALVVYRDLDQYVANAEYISARRLTPAGSSVEMNLDTVDNDGGVYYGDVAACADPQNGGWIAVWSKNSVAPNGDRNIHYQAIAPDGSLRGSEQAVSTSNENAAVAIACRSPHPLLDLEFDEQTTSVAYADSTQYGNDAICKPTGDTCPVGGEEGRFGNGVIFDGVNDQLTSSFTQPTGEFTVEFWLKTTCQNCDILNHLGGKSSIYLKNGEICAKAVGSSGSGTNCSSSGTNFADGEWHHVFRAFDAGAQILYFDGHISDYTSFSFSNVACTSNCDQFVLGTAGNNFFKGTLDRVIFHDRRLSNAEMQKSFSAAVTILDLDETAGATTAYDAANHGFNATCSGSTCPTFGAAGVANTAAEFDGSNDFLEIDTQKQTLESLVYEFEDGDTSGWSKGALSSATRNGSTTHYLGNFGNQEVTLNLSNLPTHDTVTLAFDLYVLGSWDGNRTDTGPDLWEYGHDGTSLLHTTFSNQPDTSPNYQTYPAGAPFYVGGITLYENSNFSGDHELFQEDDPDLRDNNCSTCIGNDRTSAVTIFGDTTSILYDNINYGGTSWIMDPKRGNNNVPTNDKVSSLRVFSSLYPPKYRSSGDALKASGFSETSVYHLEYTLDDHIADTLSLYFEGLASDDGQERWGLDNVVVQVQSDGGSIPLTNASFTLSAWAKRDPGTSNDYIISQGTTVNNQGVYFGYEGNKLVCSIWGSVLTWTVANDSDWHHVACAFYSPSLLRKLVLYYDGAPVGTSTAAADYSGFGSTYIGKRFPGTGDAGYFGGTLDEVAIWTQPLTDDQILELYQKVRVEDQSVLNALVPVQEDADLFTEDLILRETATGAGTEAQVVTRTLSIDADAPSTAILAPAAGDYLSGLNTLEISGAATDPTSYVNGVEVKIDGGSWLDASGTGTWSYILPAGTLADGLHTVTARATDVVGNSSSAASVQFVVDDAAPNTTIDTLGTLRSIRDNQGRWFVPIHGTASEPAAGSQPGSGLVSVDVLLQGGPNVVGNGWQTTTLSAGDWALDYILPQVGTGDKAVGSPSGVYTVTVRATDAVGNTTPAAEYTTEQLILDIDAPIPTLATSLPVTQPITTALKLSGQILDASLIDSVEVDFSPGGQVDVLSGSILHLPLDENQEQTQYFSDLSGSNHPAVCNTGNCPTVGQTGQRDQALDFDGVDDYLSAGGIELANHSFTVAAWAKRDVINQNHVIVSHGQAITNHGFILLLLNSNQARCSFWANNLTTTETYTDTNWHLWACSYDMDTGLRTMYRDGVQIAQDNPGVIYQGSGDLLIGRRQDNTRYFDGLIDEVIVYDRALADYEIANLNNYGLTTWEPVIFDNSVLNPNWSYTIPEGLGGLEGIVQLNARATDVLGNVTQLGGQRLWRGEIDTLPPRSVFTATQVAVAGYPDVTNYTCEVFDFNLDVDASCVVQSPDTIPVFDNPDLQFVAYASYDPWYASVISDTSRLYSMLGQKVYNGDQPTDMSVQSCDAFGRCTIVSNASAPQAIASSEQTPPDIVVAHQERQEALNLGAGVITPTNGSILTTTEPQKVKGFAFASDGLKALSVTANDVEVYSQNWPVTHTITNTAWKFTWEPADQGIYHFQTIVQDWTGNTTSGLYPSTFYVDTEPPLVQFSSTVLTTTNQFGDRSVLLRGTALDAVQARRVEVSIDGGAWQDAGLDETGSWQWPWPFNAQPDGELFEVRARATDLAGRMTVEARSVLVDITPPKPATITLSYLNDQGETQAVQAGDTLTDALSLQVSWTVSSDGSGVASYHVGWT